MADSKEIEFEPLTPDELRETGTIFPPLDGVTIWRKKQWCEYCFESLKEYDVFYILQTTQRSNKNHVMCPECWRVFLENSSSSDTETE